MATREKEEELKSAFSNQHKLQTDRDITLAVLGEECKNKTRRM